MLDVVGAASLDQLIDETVPASIRQSDALDWLPLAEHELLQKMREVAAKNRVMVSLIGQGYTGRSPRPRSSAISLKTRPGTRPIPPTSPRSRKAGSRRS